MKRTITFLFFALLALAVQKTEAQTKMPALHGPYSSVSGTQDDSLMYDGSFGTSRIKSYSGDCPVRVRHASGKNTGVRRIAKLTTDCGSKVIDTIYTKETAELRSGDEVYLGEELSTGEDGFIELEIYEGSVLRMAPNTRLKISGEFCDNRSIFVFNGSLWTKIKKLLGGGKFEVSTQTMGIGVRGTEFSVTADNSKTVLKVYEGKVETKYSFEAGMSGLDGIGTQVEKIQQEFEDGKISMEELTKKMQEIAMATQSSSQNMAKTIMVEAGYMATATDRLSDPEKIPAGDDKWFEDGRFLK